MKLVLLLALLAPVLPALALVERGVMGLPDRWIRAVILATAAGWIALLTAGDDVSLGPFHATPLAAAAAAGAALGLLATEPGGLGTPAWLPAVELAVVAAGLSAGVGTSTAWPLMVAPGIAALVRLGVDRWPDMRSEDDVRVSAWVALAGSVVAGAGLALADTDGHLAAPAPGDASAAVMLGGSVLLCIAAALRSSRAGTLLLAPGLVVGLASAGIIASDPGGALAVVAPLVVGAVVLAVASWLRAAAHGVHIDVSVRPAPGAAVLPLALLAFAAAAGPPGAQSAARLLAAGVVLADAVGQPWAPVTGIPGGIALVPVLVTAGGASVTVLGIGLALTGVAIATHARGPVTRPPVMSWPALAVGAWLLVAPGSWAWVGAAELGAYDSGARVVVAAAGVVLTSQAIIRARHARVVAPEPA